MIRKPVIVAAMVLTGLLAGWTAPAEAGFGDLQRFLFRGAEYVGNTFYISRPEGGPLFNYNSFDQRLQWNRLAQGYTWESYRFFGPDSFGNENTLDLGPFKVRIGQDSTLLTSGQPLGIHSKIGYTTRFLPEVFFQLETGQREYNQFSGVTNFRPVPLRYDVTFNTGIQDFSWSGNALINMEGRLNLLGFYDFDLRFVNVGNYQANGIFLHDEQVTDFDVGPINVSGHLGFDLLASLLQGNGSTTDAIPPRIFSGAAQKDKRTEELLARLNAGETLTEEELSYIAKQMISTAFALDPLGVLTNGLPAEVPGFEGFSLSMTASTEDQPAGGTMVPEPGTLLFLAGAAAAISALNPRRWRRP